MDTLPTQTIPERTRGLIDKVLGALRRLVEETESPEAGEESGPRYADAVLAVEHQRPNMEAAMLDLEEAGYAGRYGVEDFGAWSNSPIGDDFVYNDVPNAARIRWFYGYAGCKAYMGPYKPSGVTVAKQVVLLRTLERDLLAARVVCPDKRGRRESKVPVFDATAGILTVNRNSIRLTDSERRVVGFLVENRAASFAELQLLHNRPDQLLRRLIAKHPKHKLERFIILPHGSGKGGYSTTIEASVADVQK